MKSKPTSIRSLYGLAQKMWRRHGKLIAVAAALSHTLSIGGWILLVPPDNALVEAVLVLLISSWTYYPARLANRKRWRVVLPLWTAVVLILTRTGNFDVVSAVFTLGALGLIAFIN